MQSVFRSLPQMALPPWSGALSKAGTSFVAHADLPVAGNANGKRKRNLDASPRGSPVPAPKKVKNTSDNGGAVRTAPKQFIRGPDGNVVAKNVVMSAIAPKPEVPIVQYCAGTTSLEAHNHGFAGYAPPTYYWQGQYSAPSQQPAFFVNSGEDGNAMARDGQHISHSTTMSAVPVKIAASPSPPLPSAAFVPTSLATQQGSTVRSDSLVSFATTSVCKPLPSDTVAGASRTIAPAVTSAVKPHLPVVDSQASSLQVKEHVPPPKAKAVPKMDVNINHVRAICELEINQAILTKHNELRLIDQEIAKCQVALEQIRRCQLLPFPALVGFSSEVANHSGSSLLAPAGLVAAQYPAPWGVTDGPYTQNLAPWLIQSPHFDPRLPETGTPIASPYSRDGRANRGFGQDMTPLSATFQSARSSRASIGRGRHSLDAQSSSQPQRDPLVIKRNQDNQWVKLYCSECKPERSDFANVQGFLNHCRISHKLDYKSHEAAAIACGRVVQINESMMATEPVSARDVVPKQCLPVSAPVSIDSSVKSGIHPFITGPVKGRENKHIVQQILPRIHSTNDRKATGLSTPTTPTVESTFKASSGTPYLSQLVAKSGFAGDFGATVESAKRKVDLSAYDDSESENEAQNAKKPKHKKKGSATLSGVKIKLKAKPNSRGPSATSTPSFGPVSNMHPNLHSFPSLDSPMSDASGLPTPSEPIDTEMGMSPHGADSNPGLVSDRDEDDDDMDEDEPSPTDDSRRVSEAEMMVAIEDSDGETERVIDQSQRICAAPGSATC